MLEEVKELIDIWSYMTDSVLALEPLEFDNMQILLNETYLVLLKYHQEEYVPKAITALFLEMNQFLYFIMMMETNELEVDTYRSKYLYSIIKGLEQGFINGNYECEYPKLIIYDLDMVDYTIDFSQNIFE